MSTFGTYACFELCMPWSMDALIVCSMLCQMFVFVIERND